MAEVLDVNPTRGNLLRLKHDLASIRTRHDLLERNREILVQELMKRLDKARELEEESRDRFQAAHESIQVARMRVGSDRIDWISLSPTVQYSLEIEINTIMGLRIPTVEMEMHPITLPYGLSDTSASLDEAREKWIEVLRFLSEDSETFTSVWRLAIELRKTRRQVNALKTTIIPRYENTVRSIEERLEEEEREEIVRSKKIRELQRT